MGYKGLYIYYVYLPYKNKVVQLSSITFNELGTFLTTPISEEEGSDNNICWVPLEELYTKDTVLEVSQALQEGSEASRSLQEGNKASRLLQEETEASQALQEADKVSRASQSGGDSQLGGTSGD